MGCVEVHQLLEERHEAAAPSGGKVKALGQEDSVEGFAVTQAALDVAEGDVSPFGLMRGRGATLTYNSRTIGWMVRELCIGGWIPDVM